MPSTDAVQEAIQALPTSSVVEAFFQATESICYFVESVVEPVLTGQLGLDERQKAIVGTYMRVIAWLKALARLNSPSHYQAIASAARSLFELLLDLKLLVTDSTGEQVAKFHVYPRCEKYRTARKLVLYCDKNPETRIDCSIHRQFVAQAEEKANILSLVEQHWGFKNGRPRWPGHWSGQTVSERAMKLGPECEEMYVEFYPFLSWHIHSGSTGYVGLGHESMERAFGMIHGMIQRVVLLATEICAKEMKIDRLDNLQKPFHQTIEDLRQKTDAIVLQKYDELRKHRPLAN